MNTAVNTQDIQYIKPSFRLSLQRVDNESQTRLKQLKLYWKEKSAVDLVINDIVCADIVCKITRIKT